MTAGRGGRARDDVVRGCHVAPRHLARRYVARASGGCWGRSRHAGGPARAKERVCLGSGWQGARGDHALRARKEASRAKMARSPQNRFFKWRFRATIGMALEQKWVKPLKNHEERQPGPDSEKNG